MSKQAKLVEELLTEYKLDSDVRAVLLCGSVARNQEKTNSDIDIWLIRYTDKFIHKTYIKDTIKIDLFEISISMLDKFIKMREAPAINALLEGKILYNTNVNFDKLINDANISKKKEFIPINVVPASRVTSLLIQLNNLIDDAEDCIEDELTFEIIFSEIIVNIYNYLYDFYGIWREPPKKTVETIKSFLPSLYENFERLISPLELKTNRITAARLLAQLLIDKHGGIPDECILTEIDTL